MEVTIKEICRTCGGDGTYNFERDSQDFSVTCPGCGGGGKITVATIELDVPTTAQFQAKFQEVEDALQAIWNKVKNL